MAVQVCQTCQDEFKSIGIHWHHNPSHRPSISDRQHQTITGMLLGDGCIARPPGENPRFVCAMVNEEFIRWLGAELDWLTPHVSEVDTSDSPYDSQPQYQIHSKNHPGLERYASWYDTGEKTFPLDEIDLTPTVMKMWFVSDGSMRENEYGRPNIRISCYKDHENLDDIANKISEDVGVKPTVSGGHEPAKNSIGEEPKPWGEIEFNRNDTSKLYDYMGSSPPGFEYKWP